jgi:peptidoglycan/LPS O-acetylase OafA/YrhL
LDRPRQHLAFIHGLRGIAAMLVVWAHLGTIWVSLHGESAYSDRAMKKLVMQPFRIFQDGGHLGVILFFLISGYIITYTSLREDRTSFAVKRILRLGPPLLVALAVVWVYLQYADHLGVAAIGVHDGSVLQWVKSVFLLDGWSGVRVLDVTWTLVIEIIFYTLTFVLLGLSRARPEAATWAMTGLWAALCVTVAVVPGISTSVNVTLPGYVGFLLVGRAIYLWTAGIIRPIVAVLNAALGLLLYASFTERLAPGLIRGVTSPTAEPYYTYAYALIIFLGLMSWAPRRTVQPFTLLGDISYSLYLLHVPVGFATFELTSRWGFPPDLMIASAIAASILAAWLCYQLVERPSQRVARSILRQRKDRAAARTVVLTS